MFEGDTEFEEALKHSTPGRFLLDIKRDGSHKCRGVKQGFKEDRATADGPGFNYYAHVARFASLRASLFQYRRGNRRVIRTPNLEQLGNEDLAEVP